MTAPSKVGIPEAWRKPLRGFDPWASAGKCHFDIDAARHAVGFFSDILVLVEGESAGKPFKLQPWQEWIVAHMFGWRRPDGLRRFRKVFLYVPRGNGKTAFAAGILCYVAFCDPEEGAQLYSAAAEREQASLTLRIVRRMIEESKPLFDRSRIYSHSIKFSEHNGTYRSLSSEASTKHGLSMSFGVIDELHAHKSRELYDVLWTSTRKRRQPLCVITTTADYDRPSVCNDELAYAKMVRDREIEDETMLPVIYEAAQDADWTDPEVWHDVNPNMGVTITEEDFAAEVKRAKVSPEYEGTIRRLGLNQRTSVVTRWISLPEWDACGDTVDLESLRGKRAWLGIDLSTTVDLTAVTFFVEAGDGKYYMGMRCFTPEASARERGKADKVSYDGWARAGWLTLTPGSRIEYGIVRDAVIEMASMYNVGEIGIDPYNSQLFAEQLREHGLNVVLVPQTMPFMSPPAKEFERMIGVREIVHDRNPVLRWMLGNAMVHPDANGNIRPMKNISSDRIDGVTAGLNALHRLMEHRSSGASMYENRGILVI